jgi:predicted amidophosphoribosyltransferase
MNRKKFAARGYNQSELLAVSMSKASGIPFLRLLREKKGSSHQREFSSSARYINVIDRYETLGEYNLSEKTILLIDDVFTTGATINECSRILSSAGVRSVFSLTVARSDLKKLENI